MPLHFLHLSSLTKPLQKPFWKLHWRSLIKPESRPQRGPLFKQKRRVQSCVRGSVLIEMTIALVLLGLFSFVTLKGSIDVIAPRQWTINQTMSDSYMSFEQSYAERISFEEVTSSTSPWPISPLKTVTSDVALGVMPGGRVVTGTVTRTRTPDPLNIPSTGTAADIAAAKLLNPVETESWRIRSILTYQIGNKTYYKSRTVVRSQ